MSQGHGGTARLAADRNRAAEPRKVGGCGGTKYPHTRKGRVGEGNPQSSLGAAGSFSWMSSMTVESVNVVTSPSSRFSATSRSNRRMIFPDRVLGSSATGNTRFGLAIGPSVAPT